jgi:hypothetical protein
MKSHSVADIMTKLYETLAEQPRTGINMGDLSYDERVELRQIRIQNDKPNVTKTGQFTTVYYLAGDEQAAVERFVEENREQLEQLDFSKRDIVQSAVDRELYDLILDELGERQLTKFERVVREDRSNGEVWLIARERFDERPTRRYTETASDVLHFTDQTPEEIFDDLGDVITQSDIETRINGDGQLCLEYFRVADQFSCVPVTRNNEMAIEKVSERTS